MRPGTVSEILWHFTGGPLWNTETLKQDENPKPESEAFAALTAIISSQTIKVGSNRELVAYETEGRTKDKDGNFTIPSGPLAFETSKVCCLADIPLENLEYHSKRYGRFAIGFSRNAAINAHFHPVQYALSNSRLAKSQFAVWMTLKNEFNPEEKGPLTRKQWDYVTNHVMHLISFTKTFDATEFPTIYCEREWRSIYPFNFQYEDIKSIILPESGERNYYSDFKNSETGKKIPDSISVMSWDSVFS